MDLLDSNILIYAAQPGHEFLDVWITSATAGISAVSIPEVFGFPELRDDDEAMFRAWFSRLKVSDVTSAILWKAADLRRQHRKKLGDSIIAATALLAGASLVTRTSATSNTSRSCTSSTRSQPNPRRRRASEVPFARALRPGLHS